MPAESSPRSQLHYAPPSARTRKLVRRFWLPALLLLLMGSGYWWAPPMWSRAQLAYWYRQCLDHQPPAGTVVRELRGGGAAEFPPAPQAPPPYVPNAWQRFYTRLSPPGFVSSGTAFLGARRTPEGRDVLVAVDVRAPSPWASASERDRALFHLRAFDRKSLIEPPRQFFDSLRAVPVPRAPLRVFAGTADPNDPTHFTIRYETTDGRVGEVDGWVRANGIDVQSTPPPKPAGEATFNRPLPSLPD